MLGCVILVLSSFAFSCIHGHDPIRALRVSRWAGQPLVCKSAQLNPSPSRKHVAGAVCLQNFPRRQCKLLPPPQKKKKKSACLLFFNFPYLNLWGSTKVGWEVACATVSPHLYVHCHTYKCNVTRHSGSCTTTSDISIMEFVVSWRLLQLKAIPTQDSEHNKRFALTPTFWRGPVMTMSDASDWGRVHFDSFSSSKNVWKQELKARRHDLWPPPPPPFFFLSRKREILSPGCHVWCCKGFKGKGLMFSQHNPFLPSAPAAWFFKGASLPQNMFCPTDRGDRNKISNSSILF